MDGPVGVGVPGAFAVLLERLVVGALAVLEAMVVVLVERVLPCLEALFLEACWREDLGGAMVPGVIRLEMI